MRVMAVAAAVFALALVGSSSAGGAAPGAGVICGSEGCGNGGSTSCFDSERTGGGGGWTGGTVTAHLHYCIDWNGNVWDVWGYATHSNPCCAPWARWDGYQFAYQAGASYRVGGQFAASVPVGFPPVFWVTIGYDYPTACVQADGYGNVWSC